MRGTVGWDVGGAHLKAARVEQGRITAVCQVPCRLWLGLDKLGAALEEAIAAVGAAERHGITTTGELADSFASRQEGVSRIVEFMSRRLSPAPVRVYAGPSGFLPSGAVAEHWGEIASANWHATATLVASHISDALLIDMGSTTTDVIPVVGGRVSARGYTDAARLAEGELVYTGLTRTGLMSVSAAVPFRGRWVPLMNEYFATMADAYRVLGELNEHADQHPPADGREKTKAASQARLARMVGCDAGDAPERDWTSLASWFAEAQMRSIEDAARQVLSGCGLSGEAPLIGAGVGELVLAKLACRLARAFRSFDSMLDVPDALRPWSSACAPAVSTALLAEGA
jgi:probable H4MPT-linked C1 transfer pathway protein